VLLRDRDEVFAALADIGCHPNFERLCAFVRDCAAFGVTPMGSHEHSPAAEAYGGAHTHALAVSRAARGGSPQRRPQQAASASMGVSDGSGNASMASGGSGLDGSYWRPQADWAAAAAAKRPRRAGMALGPRDLNL
jgi:hypothetical protein